MLPPLFPVDRIIFFDLETSALHRVGQILNFCFAVINADGSESARLKGKIKIASIELPEPGSISANRIDVIDQQNTAEFTEYQAMKTIHEFLTTWGPNKTTSAALSGYNIEKFDVVYLRTSLARNGFFPYIGKLRTKDLRFAIEMLLSTNDSFRRDYQSFLQEEEKSENPQFSVKLERVAHFFGCLTGTQLHESEFDVDLTIAVANELQRRFHFSLFSFEPYHLHAAETQKRAQVVTRARRSFTEPTVESKICFLKKEGNASFWADLDLYEKHRHDAPLLPRDFIKRLKHFESKCWLSENGSLTETDHQYAAELFQKFSNISSSLLYDEREVYIEQWIYRLSFDELKLLGAVIHGSSSPDDITSDDLMMLYRRFLLTQSPPSSNPASFQRYARYRYGGKMRLYDETDPPPAGRTSWFHPTFGELQDELRVKRTEAHADRDAASKIPALEALAEFYEHSDVAKYF